MPSERDRERRRRSPARSTDSTRFSCSRSTKALACRASSQHRLVQDRRRWRCTGSGRCRTGSSPACGPSLAQPAPRRAAPRTTTHERRRRSSTRRDARRRRVLFLRDHVLRPAVSRWIVRHRLRPRSGVASHYLARKPASFISCVCVALGLLDPVAVLGAAHRRSC